MKFSDLYPAQQMDLTLILSQDCSELRAGFLLQLKPADQSQEFWLSAYGEGTDQKVQQPRLCRTDRLTADCLRESFEHKDQEKRLFLLASAEGRVLRVQAYCFAALIELKCPVRLQVPADLLCDGGEARLRKRYISNQLGVPTLAMMEQKTNQLQLLGDRWLLPMDREGDKLRGRKEKWVRRLPERPIALYAVPEIQFVEEEASETAELLKHLTAASQEGEYLKLWETYAELSQAYLEEERETIGCILYCAYTSRLLPEGIQLRFTLEELPEEKLLGRELAVELVPQEKGSRSRAAFVGTVQSVEGCELTTVLTFAEERPVLPSRGKLQLHTLGEQRIQRRRQVARDRILSRSAPLFYLKDILEQGTTLSGEIKPLPGSLLRKYPAIKTLNPQQRAALELALGTEDIALIQGPPGCGKTTVIRLLCQCFREQFEEAERKKQEIDPEYMRRSPRILITSFQHEAVDQAIAEPAQGDLPAYRKTGGQLRSESRLRYQESLDRWLCRLREQLSTEGSPAVETYLRIRQSLLDEAASYRNADMDPRLGAALLRHYLSFSDIPYPEALLREVRALLRELDAVSIPREELPEDPICTTLRGQRLCRESFSDDGPQQAKRLLAYLRLREEGKPQQSIIEAVCHPPVSDEAFDAYVEAVEGLKARLLGEGPRLTGGNEAEVNRCILELQDCFSQQASALFSDRESKKALILQGFLHRLEQEGETVVQRYSNNVAATCQGALDLRLNKDTQYDLVVVDEAARANPLDLFIPLSMGRKLVLVGDHRQLPHMLEPAIWKKLKKDPSISQMPELQISLFQRLFELLRQGPRPKAMLLCQQYRMHPAICRFVSEAFYDGALTTAENVTPELRAPKKAIHQGAPLVFVSVPRCCGGEMGEHSRSRPAEVRRIVEDVLSIFRADPKATVGIITFYGAQAALLRSKLDSALDGQQRLLVEVGTVDAFQGKEFDYVLLSCVRSNPPGKDGRHAVGFLDRPNRLCVAFSRAIRQLAVYGDPDTLDEIPCFHQLLEFGNAEGGEVYLES